MKIQIIKGTMRYIEDCTKALSESTLGERYFAQPGSARYAVEEALASDTAYIATVEDECVGFIYYLPQGAFHSFPYIHLIAVNKDFRGKGIGRQLMHYVETVVELNKLFLVVTDFNPKAKQFYEQIGYTQVGTIPSLYREGMTEQLMMKVIER